MIGGLLSSIDIVRRDIAKAGRFVAVAMVMVPAGSAVLWLLLQTTMNPVLANVVSVCVATIPNYLLNRYWVWQKSGSHSITREIAPFWVLAFMGLVLSSLLVWIAARFTNQDWIFLAVNLVAFGSVWVLKFFVIERFLFGADPSA